MLPELPTALSLIFGLTTLLACWLFCRATTQSTTTLLILATWLCLQAGLAATGFYLETQSIPPRFPLLLGPPTFFIACLFLSRPGRRFVQQLRLDRLTLLHSVRILVEVVLFGLATYRAVPESMTFQGSNFDILAGLTAPLVYYWGFVKGALSRRFLIGWNLASLALVMNIVLRGVLSAPSPIQQFAFDQPNVAILYFPFVWLPSVVVPLVLIAHLSALWQLLTKEKFFWAASSKAS